MGEHIYDMIIIGAGPAGLGTAIYAVRAGFDVLVIERGIAGGQIINTTEVDNYLGLAGIGGFELGDTFRAHAEKLGVSIRSDEICSFELADDIKVIKGSSQTYEARTCVLAMGAHHSTLGIPGEKEFTGMGVSYCATCDGAFFRGRNVAVIGGGNVAVEDAIYLSSICEKVTLIHRRDSLRADKVLQEALLAKGNVELAWKSVPEEILGEGFVQGLRIQNKETQESKILNVDAVFIAVGMEPENTYLPVQLTVDEKGYIIALEDCVTNIPGVFAVGDIRTKQVRQVITAVADGACAVHSAQTYLSGKYEK